jgi:hypothetical protein
MNKVLIGKFVSWPNIGDEDSSKFVGCGRGKIIAVIGSKSLLIRRLPRNGDTEPPYMLVLSIRLTNMHFFNTLREEEKWYTWVFSNPEPVLRLVEKE